MSPDSQDKWRLYFGASYDKHVHGMYSYFPCQRFEPSSRGFGRPKISLPGKITGNLNQGEKYSGQPNLDTMKLLWDKVAKRVTQKGLALGVFAEMPKRRFTRG